MKQPKSGGGWKAIAYTFRMANRVGWWKLWSAMRTKNTCKTCALGMGGQMGGMINEGGYFPEVCKKSFQAMVSDMQNGISKDFFKTYSIEQLKAFTPKQLESSGRIVTPLHAKADDKYYRPISWEEAFEILGDRLKQAGPQRSFFYASGRSSNEAGFLLQLFARLFGTNYINNCSYYCHQASGVGLTSSIGVGTGTIQLGHLDKTDLYILIGANPASNHPRLMRSLMQIKRRGGEVVVINPAKELGLVNFRVPSDVRSLFFGSEIACQYLQPNIGGDIPLLYGLAKEVLSRNAQEKSFIEESTLGFEEFAEKVNSVSWEEIERESGVSREEITKLADRYVKAKNVVIGWAMGITHHKHGCDNVRMISNIALMRGMVGKPDAGLMPIRGHSNVQGVGSVGVTPLLKQEIISRFEKRLGINVPTSPGLDTMGCMQAADQNEIDTAICLGGNLYGSNPDLHYASQALSKIGFIAYMNTTLNQGHFLGRGRETLILPVLARDEEQQSTTQESMFSYVRLSDGGPSRYSGPKSEVTVLTTMGKMVLGEETPIDWDQLQSHDEVRSLIADLIPGYEPIKEIGKTNKEFHILGRHFSDRKFNTPTGKASFHAVPIPKQEGLKDNQLRLMTIRSEGQFNTVVYEEEDLYRGQDRRDVILMNPEDIKRMGFLEDQPIRVWNETGEMRKQRVRPFAVRSGNAMMYCPEANYLVSRTIDPESKTPAFKNAVINLEAEPV